jgi:hypothetical protein
MRLNHSLEPCAGNNSIFNHSKFRATDRAQRTMLKSVSESLAKKL